MMYHQRSEDSGYVTVEIQKPIADFEKKRSSPDRTSLKIFAFIGQGLITMH
jgi:hypothetical protein